MSFQSLNLNPSLLWSAENQGLTEPTPIQQQSIPALLEGVDLLGIAKTGSGKTASFALPILHQLQTAKVSQGREPSALILVPTRELAQQIAEVFNNLIEGIPERIKCLAVFGGAAINPQMQALRSIDVLIATPGRLIDLIEKNAVRISSIKTLVLDEADKMLNTGFRDELDVILAQAPAKRQNVLFSATLNEKMEEIKDLLLDSPTVVKIESGEDNIELIDQSAYKVTPERKGPLLRYLIRHGERKQVLVFAGSAKSADGIVNKLRKNKVQAMAIHGQKSQGARNEALKQFKAGALNVLVATDLLARGIDIEFLPCVINYELPRSPKDYIHRIGRTGRAENPGEAISILTDEDLNHFKVIQKKMNKRIALTYTEDLDLHGF